ncbi:hypothetical protein IAD21_05250 [Abditibacteriota bacterium]|nr:hypothetical protein IAD21_05250 [Abditibacteriota bacterium]
MHRKTPEIVVWNAIEGQLSLEEAAKEFVNCDWYQSALSYLIPGAEVVEQLAYDAPMQPEERSELEARVRAFFWAYMDDLTAPAEEKPNSKIYPL